MARPKKTDVDTISPDVAKEAIDQAAGQGQQLSLNDLVNALSLAINSSKPREKKNFATYKPQTPWTPQPGEAKLKLKRPFYQHGIAINEEFLRNETIALINKLKPGIYCDGWVKVIRRRDKGIDLDWPVKTADQRLKLVANYGIRNIDEALSRCLDEAARKKSLPLTDEGDDT